MAQVPEKYIEIESKLGEPLDRFVRDQRGEGVSWRRIGNAILLKTGVDVASESLRMWFQGRDPVPQAASHPTPTHPKPSGPSRPLPPTQPKPSNPPKSATEENGEAA